MAAALLESFGYPEISMPRSLDVSLLPGVITNWKMRLRPNDDRLDAESVARLAVDETWARLSLPQDDKLSRRAGTARQVVRPSRPGQGIRDPSDRKRQSDRAGCLLYRI